MNSRKKLKSSKERGSDQKATRCGKRASDYHPHALPSFIRTSMATDTRSKLYILSLKQNLHWRRSLLVNSALRVVNRVQRREGNTPGVSGCRIGVSMPGGCGKMGPECGAMRCGGWRFSETMSTLPTGRRSPVTPH